MSELSPYPEHLNPFAEENLSREKFDDFKDDCSVVVEKNRNVKRKFSWSNALEKNKTWRLTFPTKPGVSRRVSLPALNFDQQTASRESHVDSHRDVSHMVTLRRQKRPAPLPPRTETSVPTPHVEINLPSDIIKVTSVVQSEVLVTSKLVEPKKKTTLDPEKNPLMADTEEFDILA